MAVGLSSYSLYALKAFFFMVDFSKRKLFNLAVHGSPSFTCQSQEIALLVACRAHRHNGARWKTKEEDKNINTLA